MRFLGSAHPVVAVSMPMGWPPIVSGFSFRPPPPHPKPGKNHYVSILGFALLTIVFDISYCSINGPDITSKDSTSAGTKFAFSMYVLALIFKAPLCFVLARAHVSLSESSPTQGGGGFSSPMQQAKGPEGYDSSTPYDPSPMPLDLGGVRSPSGVEVEMTNLPTSPIEEGRGVLPPRPP